MPRGTKNIKLQARYARDVAQRDRFVNSPVKNHVNFADIFYPRPSSVARDYFVLVKERGSHAVRLGCVVRHVTRCTTDTYPKFATADLRLCCKCVGRNHPSRATEHNYTQIHRLAWGTELGHHSPVSGEAPGRVGRCGRSMRGRRRGQYVSVFSRRRRVISRRSCRVVSLLITLRGSVRCWATCV